MNNTKQATKIEITMSPSGHLQIGITVLYTGNKYWVG